MFCLKSYFFALFAVKKVKPKVHAMPSEWIASQARNDG